MNPKAVITVGLLLPIIGCDSDLTQDVPDASPPVVADAMPCPGAHTYFLNQAGASFSRGKPSGANNTSPITDAAVDIPAAGLSTSDWAEVMACARDLVAPFNIRIVDTDPSPTEHSEIVFTADPASIGLPPQNAVASFSCGLIDPGVAFVFTEAFDTPLTNRQICEMAAWDIAKLAGIDNTRTCASVTHWNGTECSNDLDFFNDDLPCGETQQRSCQCGGDTVNPYRAMLDTFGPNCNP